MPSFVGGLKQGWAFAWRSLMAGELHRDPRRRRVGFLLQQYRNLADAAGLIAMMIVILVVGIVVDAAVFGTLDRWVRRRHGLIRGLNQRGECAMNEDRATPAIARERRWQQRRSRAKGG